MREIFLVSCLNRLHELREERAEQVWVCDSALVSDYVEEVTPAQLSEHAGNVVEHLTAARQSHVRLRFEANGLQHIIALDLRQTIVLKLGFWNEG